jgi:acetylglutamate/LysW-gamma-L-alpha-aminoadipate kinase
MSGARLVIKIGGSLTDPSVLLDDIATHDPPVVVVHGAHRVLDDLGTRLGHAPRYVVSEHGATSRYTDAVAMDHFLMAYCGLVNKRLVEQLQQRGVRAAGFAAMDGGTVRGRRRADVRIREGGRTLVLHGDHAGSIELVDTTLLHAVIDAGCTPVICPPALGHDGAPINVDGDRLSAELAIALGAPKMIIFADTAGLLADPDDPTSTVLRGSLDDIDDLRASARGRARVKLAGLERALRGGVGAVGICDGRIDRPLRAALDGAGSWFTPTPAVASR